MLRYLLSLTALTAAVLLLRAVVRRRVPARLVYAMWLAVLLRMLIPVSLFSVAVPGRTDEAEAPLPPPVTEITSVIPDAADTSPLPVLPPTAVLPAPGLPDDGMGEAVIPITPSQPSAAPDTTHPTEPTVQPPSVPAPTAPPQTGQTTAIDIPSLSYTVWFCGTAVVGTWFVLSACHFQWGLHKNRTYLRNVGRTRVYRTDDRRAPCLTGLPPTIYLTEDSAERPLSSLVLIHEYTHLRHGDPLWAFCRTAAVCVFWWHPLIWAAAQLSAQDAELACDEAVSAKLDDDLRIRYAHIILDTVPQTRRTVTGLGSHPIRERILRLTETVQYRILPMLLSILTVLALLGCSFGTLTQAVPDSTVSVDAEQTQNDTYAADSSAEPIISTGTSSQTWIDTDAIRNAGYTFGGQVLSTRQEDTRCRSFPLGTQYRLYIFYDPDRTDSTYPYSHRYVRLLVIDTETGASMYCETLDTAYAPSDISYLSENSCILYRLNEDSNIANAYLVAVMEDEVVVTSYPDQSAETFVRNRAYLVSPDRRYTVVLQEHPLTGDGGITVYADGTSRRILDNFQLEEANAAGLTGDTGLSAVVGYRPVGFLDGAHLVYNMIAYEGTKGWGIYDLASGENTVFAERNASVIGVHDGILYTQHGSGYGNAFDRIDRTAPDGTVTTLVSPDHLREENMYLWNDGTWIESVYRETPDTPVHSTLPGDMTVEYDIAVDTLTLRVLSEDMTEVLLSFDIRADLSRFFWQERILITEARVTAILEIERYPEIPPEEQILSAVVTDTAVGTVYVTCRPDAPGTPTVYSHDSETFPHQTYYLHYVPVFPDGMTPEYLYLYPYILPGDAHGSFRMLGEAEIDGAARYFVFYADRALSECGQMLCEREISHDEYIRQRTGALQAAPYPALVNDTVPLDGLQAHMEGLEASGVFDAVTPDYRLTVSGLSVPLVLYMHGDCVYAAEAWGHRAVFTDPLDIFGNCDFDIFETDGAIIVEGGYYGIGDVYTFSQDGTDALHPGLEASYYLHTEDGQLYYRLTNNKIADIVQTGALSVARDADEFLYAVGSATMDGGRIVLSAPEKTCTVRDNYDLEREFDEVWSQYYADMDEAFFANLLKSVLEHPHRTARGPFVGFVRDAETPWIELYSEVGGLYEASVPYAIFRDFPASDRSSPAFIPGYKEGIDFWYGEIGDFRWAFTATGPVMGTSNQNFAYSYDGGMTWEIGDRFALVPGVVLGAGFASENIGFVSLEDGFSDGDAPTIARTTDGGMTWQLLDIDTPAAYGIYRFRPLTPTFRGDDGIYPIMLTDREGSYYDAVGYTYLVSGDGGATWEWGARPIS